MKNILIDFYGSLSDVENALQIFDSIGDTQKDIISINAMMKAYNNADMNAECMELFKSIHDVNNGSLECDAITFSTALKACADGTSSCDGQSIHETLKTKKYKNLLKETMIQTNLINMYGKNGNLPECEKIFADSNKTTEIGLWNAMINAYGRNGDIKNAQNLFSEMTRNVDITQMQRHIKY